MWYGCKERVPNPQSHSLMCRLLNSQNEIASGLPCEYLNSQFTGNSLKDIRFKIIDWGIPDIQNECEKLTLKEGYYYYKLQMCQNTVCNHDIRIDIESRYYGVQTSFSDELFKRMVGKVVYFCPLEGNIHKLQMCIEEGYSHESLNQCGFA